jgi:hypothetical protein
MTWDGQKKDNRVTSTGKHRPKATQRGTKTLEAIIRPGFGTDERITARDDDEGEQMVQSMWVCEESLFGTMVAK